MYVGICMCIYIYIGIVAVFCCRGESLDKAGGCEGTVSLRNEVKCNIWQEHDGKLCDRDLLPPTKTHVWLPIH